MSDVLVRIRGTILLVFCGAVLVVWSVPFWNAHQSAYLTVSFLDVGQGDAILIETPEGIQVLIDGGASNMVLRSLAKEMSFFDRSIDMVIGTHPDSDHVGGLVDVLARYQIGTILRTENNGVSATWNAYTNAITNEGAQILFARQGQVFYLGSSTTLQVLYPIFNAANMESNTSSIVVQVTYGNTSFLLTGDSPIAIEKYLSATLGAKLHSTVLKLGHHGSHTSSSDVFLDTVHPKYAVVSAGKDNKYGHPHPEVIQKLKDRGIPWVNTAEEGTVTFVSDGTAVWKEQ